MLILKIKKIIRTDEGLSFQQKSKNTVFASFSALFDFGPLCKKKFWFYFEVSVKS